jgi:hypothetical protein|tara:strand:+ start:405 stop:524 length:120 start_codon:yes stop_codon:yes gene_type:complete
MNISDKWKKIIFFAIIVIAIEFSGYGIIASLFRLIGSVN